MIRTLVVKDEGGQIPVLTNCAEMPAAKVVHLLKMRWRQENSFKYLSDNYGVEQLIQYGADYQEDERIVDRARMAGHQRSLRGRGSVDEYLEQTAIANPHVTVHYIDPDGDPVLESDLDGKAYFEAGGGSRHWLADSGGLDRG